MTEVPGGWGSPQQGPPLPMSQPMPPPSQGWPAGPPLPSAPMLGAGLPPRPVYREPHPIATGPLTAGLGAGVVWFLLFGALARDLASYAWWSLAAAISAWLVALLLSLLGDRGVAVGVALAASVGLSVAVGVVATDWIETGNWPLW